MSRLKEWLRRGPTTSVLHRSKYLDHSRRFLDWVEQLGLQATWPGRVLVAVDARLNLRRLTLMVLYSLLLSSLIFSEIDFTYNVRSGEVATTDIKSPVSLELVDEATTLEKRRAAEGSVLPVFDADPNAYEHIYERVYRSFKIMREAVRAVKWPTGQRQLEEAIKDFMPQRERFERELGHDVPARLFEWLVEKRFSARIENVLIRTLAKWSGDHLMEGGASHLRDANDEVVIRVIRGSSTGVESTVRRQEIKDIARLSDFDLGDVRGVETLEPRDQRNVLSFAQLLLAPNLTYNLKETEDRKRKARDGVMPVPMRIQKNQTIVAEGQMIQDSHMAIIAEIEKLNSRRGSGVVSFAAAFLFVMLVMVSLSFVKRFTVNRVQVADKDLLAMGVVAILVTMVMKLFLLLTDQSLIAKLGAGSLPQTALLYLAPMASGAMLVGLLISSGELVWLFSLFMATVIGVMVDMNFGLMLVTIIGGIAGGRGVFACKRRNDIYLAGLRVGMVNAVVILLVTVLSKLGDQDLVPSLLWNVPAGFASGLLAAVVTMGFVPLLESWFNYTTDIKLLELASLNHPLMKEMIVKAPGTYHHSLVVGSMCEAAAEEIGANPLLAKVMAYYHDIGKIEHAQYFIENQRPGHNPHDHISPNMSKTILIAHVKDGAEMGLAYRLGAPIIDGILQHHGTTLISFFFNKALDEQDEDIDQVREEDFRYPGPKPQFREAALVMLADSIEAAARSLDEPTTGRLQNIVKNVIQNKFLDGQLEECNLTLKDLTIIEAAFKRILLGVYHQRIDYPMKYSASRIPERPRKRRGSIAT